VGSWLKFRDTIQKSALLLRETDFWGLAWALYYVTTQQSNAIKIRKKVRIFIAAGTLQSWVEGMEMYAVLETTELWAQRGWGASLRAERLDSITSSFVLSHPVRAVRRRRGW
jgi:hypothetical protein